MVVTEPSDTVSTGLAGTDESIPTRLLVLGMAHRDGSVIGKELYEVIEPCGLTIEQVRSQMRRLVSEGLFSRDGEGRDAVFAATDEGLSILGSTLRRHTLAYAQDAAGRGWDRKWRLVGFALPESRRSDRERFRDRLMSLGAAPLQNGVYISPHRWEQEVRDEVQRLGIAEFVTMATTDDLEIGGDRDPRHIAATLWPLDDIADTYRAFIDTYRDVPASLDEMRRRHESLQEKDWLPGALQVAIRFNACFEIDPLLPPELLPRPWPGRDARELLVQCRRLGVLTREDKKGPALFSVFDDVIATLP